MFCFHPAKIIYRVKRFVAIDQFGMRAAQPNRVTNVSALGRRHRFVVTLPARRRRADVCCFADVNSGYRRFIAWPCRGLGATAERTMVTSTMGDIVFSPLGEVVLPTHNVPFRFPKRSNAQATVALVAPSSLHACFDESLVVRDAGQLNLELPPEIRIGGFPERVPAKSVIIKLGKAPNRQMSAPISDVGNE